MFTKEMTNFEAVALLAILMASFSIAYIRKGLKYDKLENDYNELKNSFIGLLEERKELDESQKTGDYFKYYSIRSLNEDMMAQSKQLNKYAIDCEKREAMRERLLKEIRTVPDK